MTGSLGAWPWDHGERARPRPGHHTGCGWGTMAEDGALLEPRPLVSHDSETGLVFAGTSAEAEVPHRSTATTAANAPTTAATTPSVAPNAVAARVTAAGYEAPSRRARYPAAPPTRNATTSTRTQPDISRYATTDTADHSLGPDTMCRAESDGDSVRAGSPANGNERGRTTAPLGGLDLDGPAERSRAAGARLGTGTRRATRPAQERAPQAAPDHAAGDGSQRPGTYRRQSGVQPYRTTAERGNGQCAR